MKIIDINILIYAINRDAPSHQSIKEWFENAVKEDEIIGLPWIVILGFIRIVTNNRVMPSPLSSDSAIKLINEWLSLPGVRIVSPGRNHWEILKELFSGLGTAANLTTDAHIAAMAIENGAKLISTDNDFSRFSKLRWVNPLK